MTNLIPPAGRAVLVREYWLHTITVWALLFAVACGIGAALLMPTYLLTSAELRAVSTEAAALSHTQSDGGDMEALVDDVNTLAGDFESMQRDRSLSDVLGAVDAHAGADIAVSRYTVARDGAAIDQLEIAATAASRDALTSFQDALRADAHFSSADVPISDLVRSDSLPFTMDLTIADSAE
jgi:hypothetical protein